MEGKIRLGISEIQAKNTAEVLTANEASVPKMVLGTTATALNLSGTNFFGDCVM